MKKNIWFKAKRYGWGWQPASWQGWGVMLIWLLINLIYFLKVDRNSFSDGDTLMSTAPIFIFSTLFLLVICYLKGEKPGWHWGKRN